MFLISSTNFRYVKYVHNLSINLFLIQHITSLHIDYVFVGLCISFWSLTIHNESLILLSTISKFSLQVVYIPHIKLTIMSSNSYRYIILPNRTNHDLRIGNMNFFPKICMWYRYQRKSGTGWDLTGSKKIVVPVGKYWIFNSVQVLFVGPKWRYR